MPQRSIADRVKELIAEILIIDLWQVRDDADLSNDLAMDSSDLLELTSAIERELDVMIPSEDIFGMNTVQDVIDCVES